MTSMQDKIRAQASKNAELLNTLRETDYAVSGYPQSTDYLNGLKSEISLAEGTLRKASQTVAFEYADHQKYRDSHVRRIAYKLSGKKDKFADQASKEEKEWLDAVQVELQSKRALEELNSKLDEAKRTNRELQEVAAVHEATQKELGALYKSIFDGPTPDVPGEDEKEHAVRAAEAEFNDKQWKLSTENQTRGALQDANKFLINARRNIEEALDAATMDAWGVGGSFADMQKHSSLSRAQGHISQVEMLMSQAQRMNPGVGSIGKLDIAEMRFMTDVVFDNIFSDLNAKDRIKESKVRLEQAKAKLEGELQKATQRIKAVQQEVNHARSVLDGRRNELQDVRAAAFDSITSGASAPAAAPAEAPPGYSAEPPKYTS
ncbi:hypothetical protein B0J14DRAFT_610771 [Halenospora varia]|nr:hypothetical protein B0J14DRAFT_610771 [Halenospora varia]